ncbi:MAG: endopeptidase La [Chloroflexi bacterium]|mgnify:CR=1 FL=1|jgi:ATP-dependent Lon protease|nr:endopeptidase La [Chloroflexota bacterium]
MKSSDWYLRDDDDDFGEALHRRTEELYNVPNALPDEDGLIECPVLPLRDLVVYPHMVSPIFLSQESALMAVEDAQLNDQTVIALTQEDSDQDDPGPEDFFPIGVELAVGRLLSMPDGSSSALVQGRRRVEVVEFVQEEPFMVVRARPIYESTEVDREIDATMRTALEMFQRCVQLDRSLPEEAYLYALNIDEPGWLADMITTAIAPPLEERQELLMITDPLERLRHVINLLAREADVLELEDEIHSRAQSEVDRTQREYYLREQMKVIQTELGEGDPWTREVMELRSRVEAAELPEEVQMRALKEVDRLGQMPPMSPEVGIIRTYIDWILDLPWTVATEDNLDVKHAADVLERDHFGLPRAKERILEYIAVRSLKPRQQRQPILCFVGPPGTGKTSLGRSIAEALGRKFVRLSLGGVRDEAEIRGHRRTYIGALPGRILQTMRRAGTVNPLFMLDEIDKLGQDFRGDPASALLEVLDPEQNCAFSDHYLELPYDLSQVMFVTTANTTSTIPPALLDRMELIEFPGYIEEEKLEISRRFLIPRQLDENGLEENEVRFADQAVLRVIREYTYEAGVRNLEREIGRICRKVARLKAEGKRYPSYISPAAVERFLGPPQFFNLEAERQDETGVATAVAWTETGGEIMPVEVLLMEGKGNLQITGQIGNVMQESAQAALSYLKSRSRDLGLDPEIYDETDIHIHVPEGAIPKDGPSAGITICTALISAFTRRKVRSEVGMTGEITLRGRVLPVGGVREKVLAAHRAGIRTVILPRRNMKDLVDVPKRARSELKIIPVDHIDQVLEIALHPPEEKPKASRRRKKAAEKTTEKPDASVTTGDSAAVQPGAQA